MFTAIGGNLPQLFLPREMSMGERQGQLFEVTHMVHLCLLFLESSGGERGGHPTCHIL